MFGFISKSDYFHALEHHSLPLFSHNQYDLKHIQDLWMWSEICRTKGMRVAEIGGGSSRILRALDPSNEMWNVDEFMGRDGGPSSPDAIAGVKVVRRKLGDTQDALPSEYFDVVFSVSVIEHVPSSELKPFFQDLYRVMKRGARSLHAIDMYIVSAGVELDDADVMKHLDYGRRRFHEFVSLPRACGFDVALTDPPPDKPMFESWMASNSDLRMNAWNRLSPTLVQLRTVAQSVSLKLVLHKA